MSKNEKTTKLVSSIPNAPYSKFGDTSVGVSPYERDGKGKITSETMKGADKDKKMEKVPSKPSFSDNQKSTKGISKAPKAENQPNAYGNLRGKKDEKVPPPSLGKALPPTVSQDNKVPHTQQTQSMGSKVLNRMKKHKLQKMGSNNMGGTGVSTSASDPSMAMSEDMEKKHIGFKKLEGKLSHEKGITNPGGLAYKIGK